MGEEAGGKNEERPGDLEAGVPAGRNPLDNAGKFFPILEAPRRSRWYSYRWWKGAVTWLGLTTIGVLSFGFGPVAAVFCAAGFLFAFIWSVFIE